jgi:branched-chain amino acid transport system ATP-binding protein
MPAFAPLISAMPMADPMLEVRNLESSYGLSQVLFGITLALAPGEVITLLGRNGMGKTTTVNSIMGLCRRHGGEIRFLGKRIDDRLPHQIARKGIGVVPEGRRIFPNLTVRENLLMAYRNSRAAAEPWNLERVLDLFPKLGERLGNSGNHLSGGEQQMLAIGRALMTNPMLLILDEATEGLAPLIRREIWQRLAMLKGLGLSLIVIDKDVAALGDIADRHYILEKGRVVWSGSDAALAHDPELQKKYLSV